MHEALHRNGVSWIYIYNMRQQKNNFVPPCVVRMAGVERGETETAQKQFFIRETCLYSERNRDLLGGVIVRFANYSLT